MENFPKLHSPFLRVGSRYLVSPEIDAEYQWVFDDPEVICVEKLDGTNVGIHIEDGKLLELYNRETPKEFDVLVTNRYIQGVRQAYMKRKKWPMDGIMYGELMGPTLQKNFLRLDSPYWFSFDCLRTRAIYHSFHRYPVTFENLSSWLKDGIHSIMYQKLVGGKEHPEGVVFYQPSTGYMAKLRRNMFGWYYNE